MPNATQNVQTSYVGDMKCLRGDWTADDSSASLDIGLGGGRVWLAQFRDLDTGNSFQYSPNAVPCTGDTTSGAVTTITLNNTAPVTNGRFCIFYK